MQVKCRSYLFSLVLSVSMCLSVEAQQTNRLASTTKPVSSVKQAPSVSDDSAFDAAPFVDAADDFVAGHLRVGTRLTGYAFAHITGLHLDPNSNIKDQHNPVSGVEETFLGSITKLDAVQNYWPQNLYADWYFTPSLGVELTWAEIRAQTVSVDKTETPSHSDGDWDIKGPVVSVIGRYNNPSKWTPYGGAGLALMSSRFIHSTWWHTGFPSEEDWVANGSPNMSINGEYRTMQTDAKRSWAEVVLPGLDVDDVGFVVFGGCDYTIMDHLLANVYVRYMNIEIHNHYYITLPGGGIDDRTWYTIPLSNIAAGVGVSYAF